MSRRLQELKYKSYEDLSRQYAVPNLKRQKITALCKSAVKLYDEAEKQYDIHDEEQSFIFYMKYFNVLTAIREASDYQTHKNYVSALLGGNPKHHKAMERTEKLSQSLMKRYDLMRRSEECEAEAENKPTIEPEPENPTTLEKPTSITSQELFHMIKGGEKDILVLDCRPKKDFITSRLLFNNCLNIPEDVILPGMTAGRVYHRLEEEERILWNSRAHKECVVLLDWSSRGGNPVRNTPLWCLRDILENWDPDVNYCHLVMLEGGYEDYILRYPMHTTNPKAQPPVSKTLDGNLLEEIEYPSIGDIVMKKDAFTVQPSINRAAKAAAIVTYEQKEKFLQDLLQEQETIADKGLSVEMERLNAEKSWQELNESKQDKFTAEEQDQAKLAREQELVYTLMQMENRERDLKAENERIKRRLAEAEAEGAAAAEKVATQARIEEKEREKKRLEEHRKEMERERKLKEAREQKKMLREGKENAVPPSFNRDAKPQVLPPREIRDLAPVLGSGHRGLTGLKNLGNSCYMNSIVQCLSNSASLNEYITKKLYIRHINPAGRTKGRIVEELAAVVEALWCGEYRYISPIHLKHTIGAVHGVFRNYEQQDAHEFLTILMDMLHVDLQTMKTNHHLNENLPMNERAWLEFTKSHESVILRLFYGQIKSTVKCRECGKESATYESFSNLSLELPDASMTECDIENCFDMYFNGENIAGWHCPGCKQSRDAVKKLDISKLPPILVIHLKRFHADEMIVGSRYRKKQTYVRFPLKSLDLGPYLARSEKNSRKTYHLYGVSNHFGTIDSGHYTAFCLNPALGRWYNYDDDKVSPMNRGDVESSAAYILFYSFL